MPDRRQEALVEVLHPSLELSCVVEELPTVCCTVPAIAKEAAGDPDLADMLGRLCHCQAAALEAAVDKTCLTEGKCKNYTLLRHREDS